MFHSEFHVLTLVPPLPFRLPSCCSALMTLFLDTRRKEMSKVAEDRGLSRASEWGERRIKEDGLAENKTNLKDCSRVYLVGPLLSFGILPAEAKCVLCWFVCVYSPTHGVCPVSYCFIPLRSLFTAVTGF